MASAVYLNLTFSLLLTAILLIGCFILHRKIRSIPTMCILASSVIGMISPVLVLISAIGFEYVKGIYDVVYIVSLLTTPLMSFGLFFYAISVKSDDTSTQ